MMCKKLLWLACMVTPMASCFANAENHPRAEYQMELQLGIKNTDWEMRQYWYDTSFSGELITYRNSHRYHHLNASWYFSPVVGQSNRYPFDAAFLHRGGNVVVERSELGGGDTDDAFDDVAISAVSVTLPVFAGVQMGIGYRTNKSSLGGWVSEEKSLGIQLDYYLAEMVAFSLSYANGKEIDTNDFGDQVLRDEVSNREAYQVGFKSLWTTHSSELPYDTHLSISKDNDQVGLNAGVGKYISSNVKVGVDFDIIDTDENYDRRLYRLTGQWMPVDHLGLTVSAGMEKSTDPFNQDDFRKQGNIVEVSTFYRF